jgi:hypothetical protein
MWHPKKKEKSKKKLEPIQQPTKVEPLYTIEDALKNVSGKIFDQMIIESGLLKDSQIAFTPGTINKRPIEPIKSTPRRGAIVGFESNAMDAMRSRYSPKLQTYPGKTFSSSMMLDIQPQLGIDFYNIAEANKMFEKLLAEMVGAGVFAPNRSGRIDVEVCAGPLYPMNGHNPFTSFRSAENEHVHYMRGSKNPFKKTSSEE